ncbi:nonsense-mediated mRNA decay factor SMG8 [Pectinophora gossypiella]|uniref:nonsense-mediated mRNA decay factor SMG8 n=1 Tax=Pectinophora gossypiella TaxID=13191 RepID=UPI00214EEF69|nr:nonsense-mediated mRNA decay factor SMG8 [Pectinophora gossypiella]
MKVFSINDIPEFSQKERIVVVGIVGKSPYRYPNKTTPLLSSVECKENGIECHWDERRGVLYLHAVTYLDTQQLTKLAANLDENSNSTDKDADAAHWLVATGELATEACRALALVFHLSHIVILCEPTATFDLGYLQLFKAIDAYRTELAPRVTEALAAAGAQGAWETHGRACCPRLLFHFRRAPAALRRAPQALKRLEHAVEDQLYFILRKARIITNVCAKSLFAIPKNEEFVYISTENEVGSCRDVRSLVQGLVQLCNDTPREAPARPGFAQLLARHVALARADGFHDNVGKYAMTTSFFELPSASWWRTAAQALAPLYLDTKSEGGHGALYDALATDVRFSQARCAKVLPIAQASYAEGLPAHYSSQHHAHKLGVALGVLQAMARGPLAGGARARLAAACSAAWRARSLCEAPSLTNHPCIEPDHDNTKEHNSGVRYISACNCGRTKCSREDPYTVRHANYTFYTQAAEECGVCPTLQAIEFPVFQPSTPTYRAASVKGASSQDDKEVSEARGSDNTAASGEEGWSPDALSPGEDRDEDTSPEERYVVPLRPDQASDKVMTRQPSTTEYLPGMLHTLSPPGLLPAFPSWSLVCLGPSSLYSHSLGLPEHLQPGFLPHTNYLLPWDCAVRSTESAAWRASARGRGKPAGAHHVTVKIFIGFEYECPRGHRLMMSSPEAAESGAATAGPGAAGATAGAGAGARLAAASMPLCAPCVCRAPAPPPALLTRVHVVTPKAPVHVTLDPKAQPVPGGPIFVPQPAGSPPIQLSGSMYWVLRLPYVYCDERGPLPRRMRSGTLLAPLFGLQD